MLYLKKVFFCVPGLGGAGTGTGKWNKRDTTDRAKRGVWDEKRGKERKKKKISIVFCT